MIINERNILGSQTNCFFLVFIGAWLSTTNFLVKLNPLVLVLSIIITLNYCLFLGQLEKYGLLNTIKNEHKRMLILLAMIIVFCISKTVSGSDVMFIIVTFITWFVIAFRSRVKFDNKEGDIQ